MNKQIEPCKIVLAGGSGFIGKNLIKFLSRKNFQITVLTRSTEKIKNQPAFQTVDVAGWDHQSDEWFSKIDDADCVVNLAGKNIGAGRWTKTVKQQILQSRIASAESLIRAMKQVDRKPECFIQMSAIGYYGTQTRMHIDENENRGSGFLADVCSQLEQIVLPVNNSAETRCVILRNGVVLGIEDGFYRKMACMVRHFTGAVIGSGKNWISWIHILDLLKLIEQACTDRNFHGVYNAVSPEPVQSRTFMRFLADSWHRPLLPAPPVFALKLILGEMVPELLLASQNVIPKRLLDLDYEFLFPEINSALNHLRDKCKKRKSPVSCPPASY